MKITLVTGNPKKAEEAALILTDVDFAVQSFHVPEIQSFSLQEIVEAKVKAAYEGVGGPVLVEDVSLDMPALGGFPGPFVKFWLDHVGYDRAVDIAMKMGDRRATLRCGVGFCDGGRTLYTEGVVHGTLVPKRMESWGFDPYFIPDGHELTYAEMGAGKMSTLSYRYLGYVAMKQKLVEAGILS